jgi:hypothetical protein
VNTTHHERHEELTGGELQRLVERVRPPLGIERGHVDQVIRPNDDIDRDRASQIRLKSRRLENPSPRWEYAHMTTTVKADSRSRITLRGAKDGQRYVVSEQAGGWFAWRSS